MSAIHVGWMALSLLLTLGQTAQAADALVYKGPGSCEDGCSEAAALVAKLAGLHPVFVDPHPASADVFKNAAVWIQPGGKSRTVGATMSAELKSWIQNFVAAGGGYVGFCAG